jgi:cytochrome c peroxidase
MLARLLGPFVGPRRIVLLLAAALLSSVSPLFGQGQNIGDPTGRSGLWPLLQSPPGNTFQSSPTDDYMPLAGSPTQLKFLLGKALFWDEQVSSDNTMACATCHIPEVAGVDARGSFLATNNGFGSLGVLPQDALEEYIPGTPVTQQPLVTGIIAPTMLGAAFAERIFWDVRAGPNFTFEGGAQILLGGVDQFPNFAALEDQSVDPPASLVEMAHQGVINWATNQTKNKLDTARVLALATFSTVPSDLAPFVALGITYGQGFDIAFGGDPVFGGTLGVTRERFAAAVATYERTLIPNQAPIDTRGLTVSELAGFSHLVASQCMRCHSDQPAFFGTTVPVLTGTGGFVDAMDAMLTDNRRHGAIGFPDTPGALTGTQAKGSFNVKTPSLRNVMLHPRLGHNGFFTSFAQLLDFYNRDIPGLVPTFPFTSGAGVGGKLTAAEKIDVTAFFNALTDPRLIPAFPGAPLPAPFDHPDLYSQRVPLGANEPATHPGTPATPGGLVPDIIANVPLFTNDPNYKIGVRDAPATAATVLVVSPNPLPVPPPAGAFKLNPTGILTLNFTTGASGFSTFQPGTILGLTPGQVFSMQWVISDPASGTLAWSNAAEVVVQ